MEKACGGYYTRVEPEQDNAVQIAILKQGHTVHMLKLFLDIYSIRPPIYIYIFI